MMLRESFPHRRPAPLRGAIRAVVLTFVVCAGAAEVFGADEPPLPNYAMAVWASEKGLPPGDVFAMAQDLEGYLWLGTPTGLLRFDGYHFTSWPPGGSAAALPNGPVHAIVSSADGSIWVGLGGGGGVVRIHRGEVFRHLPADGAPPGVTAMIQDRQGAIWVAARRGLFRFMNGRWTLLGKAEGYSGAEAFSLYEDRVGRLWAGAASGVYQRKKDAFELVDSISTNVQSMVEDASGAMWVTDSREVLMRLSTHSAPQHDQKIRLPTGAWRLLRDGRGQIWAAAFGGGLLRVRDPLNESAIIERFDYEHRLAGSPRSLFEDRDGNMWVGMRGGLIRLSESSFTSVTALEGLTNDGVRTATADADGGVWVATGHALNRFTGSGRTAYGVSQTMALHNDRRGTLWVAGAQQISRFVNGRFVSIPVPDVVRTSRVMALTTDFDGALWLCTALKGVMTWDGQTLSRFEGKTDFADRACQSILTDRQGRVWIGLLDNGETALHIAVTRGDALVKFLAENGTSLDIKDKFGRTPLDVAMGVPGGAGGGRGGRGTATPTAVPFARARPRCSRS